MSDREALLAAILANPDEDTPRLVYADWLDEHAEPERAEFIRVQCRLPHLSPRTAEAKRLKTREKELRAKCFKHLDKMPFAEIRFQRGFVGSIKSGLLAFAKHAEKLRPEVAPAFGLILHRDQQDEEAFTDDEIYTAAPFKPIAKRPELRRCLSLELPFLHTESAEPLLSSRYLASLRRFKAHGDFSDIFDDFDSPTFSNLRWLELGDTHGNDSFPPEMDRLIKSRHLLNLEHLDLGDCCLSDDHLREFTKTPHLQQLRFFDISGSGFHRTLPDFFRTENLPSLVELNLSASIGYYGISEQDANERLAQLADSPLFARLTSLSLQYNHIRDSGAAILAASPRKVRLTRLDLSNNFVGKTARAALDKRFGRGVCVYKTKG